MKADKAGIFVDTKMLRRYLHAAQACVTKADRIMYLSQCIVLSGDMLSCFTLAHDSFDEKEKNFWIDRLMMAFVPLKTDIEEMFMLGIIHQSGQAVVVLNDREKEHVNGREVCIRMVELVARIDEGITKWRQSLKVKAKSGSAPSVSVL